MPHAHPLPLGSKIPRASPGARAFTLHKITEIKEKLKPLGLGLWVRVRVRELLGLGLG